MSQTPNQQNPFTRDYQPSQNSSSGPQHPQPAVIRQVNHSASHYNNYSLPNNNINNMSNPPNSNLPPQSSSNSPDQTYQTDKNGIPLNDTTNPSHLVPHEPFDKVKNSENSTPITNDLSHHQPSNSTKRMSASEVFDNISRQQQQVSFAIDKSSEFDLSNSNLDLPKVIDSSLLSVTTPATTTESSYDDSVIPNDSNLTTTSSNLNSNIMKRHRWGTQRHKKGRPVNEMKRNKSIFSKKRVSSALSEHSFTSSIDHNKINNNDNQDINNTDNKNDTSSSSVNSSNDGNQNGIYRVFFNMDLPNDMKDPETGLPITAYPRNKIRTTKYTPLSFIPKNLFFQFKNIANIYFLFIVILGVSFDWIYFISFN